MKILVADANSTFRKSLCRFLQDRFPAATVRSSKTQGLIREVREFSPEIIILEANFAYLRKIRGQLAGARIIMLTPHDLPEYIEAGSKYGADQVFCKDKVGEPEIQDLIEIISREVRGPETLPEGGGYK